MDDQGEPPEPNRSECKEVNSEERERRLGVEGKRVESGWIFDADWLKGPESRIGISHFFLIRTSDNPSSLPKLKSLNCRY